MSPLPSLGGGVAETEHDLPDGSSRLLPYGTLAVAVLLFGLAASSKLMLGLQRDEALTAWVLEGDLIEAVRRAIHFQGAPLFFAVEWCLAQVLGRSEVALRLLSVVAMLAAAGLLFLWSRTVWRLSRWSAVSAVIIFLSCEQTFSYFSQARPYALALFLVIASFLVLEWWRAAPSIWRSLVYAVSLAAILYTHYLFGLVLIVHGYMVLRLGVPRRRVVWVVAFGAALCAPLLPGIALFGERRDLYSLYTLSVTNLSEWIAPQSILLLPALLLMGVYAFLGRNPPRTESWRVAVLFLLVCLGPAFFYVGGLFGSFPALYRYYLWQIVGLSVALGWLFERYVPRNSQAIAGLLLALGLILELPEREKKFSGEGWRAAFAAVRARGVTRLVLFPGLVETRELDWVIDPERSEYLRSVARYYTPDMAVRLLTIDPFGSGRDYTATVFGEEFLKSNRFILVVFQFASPPPFQDPSDAWLAGIRELGYDGVTVGNYNQIGVFELRRVPNS